MTTEKTQLAVIHLYIKSKEMERSIRGKMKVIKQNGGTLYTIVPRLIDEALQKYIDKHSKQ